MAGLLVVGVSLAFSLWLWFRPWCEHGLSVERLESLIALGLPAVGLIVVLAASRSGKHSGWVTSLAVVIACVTMCAGVFLVREAFSQNVCVPSLFN